jgi:hypothetical protein
MFFCILDNFGDSDFEFLQKIGTTSGADFVGRDSVLLKFDPLLEKPLIVTEKLPITEEEEENYSESFCEEPNIEISAHSSTFASQQTAPPNPFDDLGLEMKDIDLESNNALKDSIESKDLSGLNLR